MFGNTINQLAPFLFLFVVIPIIIGLLIVLGPRLIVSIFILIGKIFVKIFRWIPKKLSTKMAPYYEKEKFNQVQNDELIEWRKKFEEKKKELYQKKELDKAVKYLEKGKVNPVIETDVNQIIIHETPKRAAEPLSIKHIHELSSKYFEIFTGIILGKMGFYGIKVTGKSHDEGVDLEAYQNNKLFVIQCKRYKNTVGRPDIQKLFGVMTDKKADGHLFTTGKFPKTAKEFSKGKSIELVDGERLIEICKQNGIKTNKQLLEEILKTFS